MRPVYFALALLLSTAAQAQTPDHQRQQVNAPAVPAAPAVSPTAQALKELQDEWARIKYQTPDEAAQGRAIERLSLRAAEFAKTYPSSPQIKVWQAIIIATKAGINGGLGALGDAKEAKALLEQVEKAAPETLDGSVFTSLASLYYKVPGWPIGFGDDEKAEVYLKKALSVNPDGIDPNFFYGDYEYEQGHYDLARRYFEKVLSAAPRPGRELADAGRRKEAQDLLAKMAGKS
jgi:tetratricopeptide (TPR) repeat protein